MENVTNKYSYLFEYPCLRQGEDKEIFTAIEKGIDVELKRDFLTPFLKQYTKRRPKLSNLVIMITLKKPSITSPYFFTKESILTT